ncbi:hypothetical protein K461DRAFT_218633 [Myriangium duriaei CBS 260.36]|uniref:N-acetyltransferase domain-containing protein n=1 Tax=Myriangium duriaei CBS 260.36 TaxID=1168546 RepID=A0A9P4J8V2_9PEZI|nr:hypothetical protein K461DRAFT_218633 [Myriangium duriaei CBS 260.36]
MTNDQTTIRPALPTDVPSLTTLLPRSFFPTNPTVKRALPDTPLMRQWWALVYNEEISNPACHLYVAVSSSSSSASSTDGVIGMASLRLHSPGDTYGGFWTQHAWTADHGEEVWRPAIDCMVEYERRLMGERRHGLLEMVAVDDKWKGKGVGRMLVGKMCEVADAERVEIFLQSGGARGYYLKLGMGFGIEAEPEWEGYRACLLTRAIGGRKHSGKGRSREHGDGRSSEQE